MEHEPEIRERAEQPYAGIRATTTADGIRAVVDEGFPALFGWLADHGIAPAAAPFIRYHAVGERFDLELGAPVAAPVEGGGRVVPGTLPAGRWATLLHVGPFDGLQASHDALLDWARGHGVDVDCTETSGGTAFGGAVEHYLVDPAQEPDSARWETEVAYLLR